MNARSVRLLAAGVLVVTMVLGGCTKGETGGPGDAQPGTPEAAVESFLSADSKHGTVAFINVWDDGTVEEQRVEYWFEGDRYRLTWFNADGSVRLHMISPDGKAVYHCRPEEKACELAYTTAEFHQWIFNGPPGWNPAGGTEEDGLTMYRYEAKKLWSIEGASQDFYLEDLQVFADENGVVKTVARTDSSVPASEDQLVTSTYRFDETELGADIPSEMFDLPYDIAEGD